MADNGLYICQYAFECAVVLVRSVCAVVECAVVWFGVVGVLLLGVL